MECATESLQHVRPDAPLKDASRDRIKWWYFHPVITDGRPVILWLNQLSPNVRLLAGVMGSLVRPKTS